VDFALLQSLTRAGPSVLARRSIGGEPDVTARCCGPTLLGFLAPTAHQVSGSDLRRVYLARLCSAFGLSQPLDALLPPRPCRFCFTPAALLGFALQRVSLPNCRDASRHPLPLLALLSTGAPKRVVRARSVPASPCGVLRRSEERGRRRTLGRRRCRARLQGFQPVSGVRTPVGGGWPPMGADPLLGFIPPGGSPSLPRRDQCRVSPRALLRQRAETG